MALSKVRRTFSSNSDGESMRAFASVPAASSIVCQSAGLVASINTLQLEPDKGTETHDTGCAMTNEFQPSVTRGPGKR